MVRAVLLCFLLAGNAFSQCEDGLCKPGVNIAVITPEDESGLAISNQVRSELATAGGGSHFEQVIRATVRVTVSGVCGSGTVVGEDKTGRKLILTNAHVAGSTKGRVVNVERWNTDGSSERGTAAIVASGYGKGMSLDFAVLRASEGFASGVQPVPMANRQPDTSTLITTFGCPRCEWPSLQVLKLNRAEGQILTWKPEAIGGRSGSSLIDYTANGPEVVGLLTWGGGGEGLGQSMPFVLNALRGRLPKSLESLPSYAKEVSSDKVYRAAWPVQELDSSDEGEELFDAVTGRRLKKPPTPEPDKGILDRGRDKPILSGVRTLLIGAVVFVLGVVCGFAGGYVLKGRFQSWLL
jgi:hypothetical protein